MFLPDVSTSVPKMTAPMGAVVPRCGRTIAIALVVMGISGMSSLGMTSVGVGSAVANVGTGVGGASVGINVGMARGGPEEHAASAAAAHTTSANRIKAERWLIPSKPSLPHSGNRVPRDQAAGRSGRCRVLRTLFGRSGPV
jgi:hypothetical protein